ncbi:MAG: helix-turn-helix transcriptional regulator [Acidimicrobiales bacterium]
MSAATIGSALAEKRRELGLEKGRAASEIGMSRTTYSSYEQDAQRPSVDVFPALAKFLDISVEELLTLYGSTCVAAMRSSLEHVMSNLLNASEEDEDVKETESAHEVAVRSQSEPSYEKVTIPSEEFESMVTFETPEASEPVETALFQEREEIRPELTVSSEREANVQESAKVETAVYEHSHLEMKRPKSLSGEKGSGNKKKKRKKQKKN